MPMDLSNLTGAVAIIPAAGIGSRCSSEMPKQYLEINGKAILELTVGQFIDYPPVELILVMVAAADKYYPKMDFADSDKVVFIEGGNERGDSVLNGLSFLRDVGLPDETVILVHDAARPCVTPEDLDKLLGHHRQTGRACLLAAPQVDTLQEINADKQVVSTLDRNRVVKALTPQVAEFALLHRALAEAINSGKKVTDEVSALTLAEVPVDVVFGSAKNIKITVAEDMLLAEFYLKQRASS